MAHDIHQMAYVGETPWHGLGNQLSAHEPIEVWRREAGMDWEIKTSPVCFETQTDELSSLHRLKKQKVLYRSDTHKALSVVSNRYNIVQPGEILEFYRDLTEVSGYELETAGVLKGGRKFWALARTGQSTMIQAKDEVRGYLLLATSCDGTLATTATPTSIRVVCNNTLALSLKGATQAIKVPHNTVFNPDQVKQQLGIAVAQWDSFMAKMKILANRKVQPSEVKNYFIKVLCGEEVALNPKLYLNQGKLPNDRALNQAMKLYNGHGRGAELGAAKDSAWGLLSTITEFIDHERQARSIDHRIDSAWFGQGASVKQNALEAALQLAS